MGQTTLQGLQELFGTNLNLYDVIKLLLSRTSAVQFSTGYFQKILRCRGSTSSSVGACPERTTCSAHVRQAVLVQRTAAAA